MCSTYTVHEQATIRQSLFYRYVDSSIRPPFPCRYCNSFDTITTVAYTFVRQRRQSIDTSITCTHVHVQNLYIQIYINSRGTKSAVNSCYSAVLNQDLHVRLYCLKYNKKKFFLLTNSLQKQKILIVITKTLKSQPTRLQIILISETLLVPKGNLIH